MAKPIDEKFPAFPVWVRDPGLSADEPPSYFAWVAASEYRSLSGAVDALEAAGFECVAQVGGYEEPGRQQTAAQRVSRKPTRAATILARILEGYLGDSPEQDAAVAAAVAPFGFTVAAGRVA
jgi:hypothetical protein